MAGDLPVARRRSILGCFLFKGDEVFKKVRVLSGGERSRLVLAKLFVQSPNFLLLDEPTNHLDIQGRKVLEQALSEYQGSLVLITHDRHLINAAATQVAYVDAGQVTLLPGNYDDFTRIWKKRLEAPPKAEAAPPAEQKARGPAKDSQDKAARKRAQAEARNQRYRKLKPLKSKVAKLEVQLEEASAKLDELVAEMVKPEAFADGERWQKLSKEHDAAKSRVDKLTESWEREALKLEKLEAEAEEAG